MKSELAEHGVLIWTKSSAGVRSEGVLGFVFVFSCEPGLGSTSNRAFPGKRSWLRLWDHGDDDVVLTAGTAVGSYWL